MDFASDVLAKGGTFEQVVAVILILILARMTYILLFLVKQQNVDGKTVATQATVIAELVGPVKEISDLLNAVADTNAITTTNLLKVVDRLDNSDAQIASVGTVLDTAITSMQKTVKAKQALIEGIPGKVREAMQEDFESLPRAVGEAIVPTIESLKEDITLLITGLGVEISDQIELIKGEVPSETARIIKEELLNFIEDKFIELIDASKKE